ncbi:MAG: hypothetical protein LBG91_03805 [Treponema sp.]|jgi:hypothetical protein|nr:hypothetical protein [Treponema sp.]
MIRQGKARYYVNRVFFAVNVIFTGFILSCGIEEYYYLPQVPQENIVNLELNNSATVLIPDIAGEYSFASNYSIYYRIYISGENESGQIQLSSDKLRSINSSLSGDYSAFEPYTDPLRTSVNTSSIGTLFKNRYYYELELDGADVRNILTTSGGTLTFQFPLPDGECPYLTFNGVRYYLFRSNDGGTFAPEPDRYFFNSAELNDNTNAISAKNADTAPNTAANGYTYVSMYIIAVGLNNLFTPVYSRPTHISIFKLPNP